MNERWNWIPRYIIVIVVALVLAGALGEMSLFKTTKFGTSGLSAANLVQFFGFGGGLLVLWLLARRAAELISPGEERLKLVKSTLLPLATLIVVASSHAVLLLVLGPLMSKAMQQIYNWIFIAGIILSAAWLVAALFTGSSSLAPLLGGSGRSARGEKNAVTKD